MSARVYEYERIFKCNKIANVLPQLLKHFDTECVTDRRNV